MVIETTLGTGTRNRPNALQGAVERLLRAVIPAANPEFEPSYEKVCKWWIELSEAGEPERELGFDEHGRVIVAGPLGRNFGFFTDSGTTFRLGDHPVVEQSLFDAEWAAFEKQWTGGR